MGPKLSSDIKGQAEIGALQKVSSACDKLETTRCGDEASGCFQDLPLSSAADGLPKDGRLELGTESQRIETVCEKVDKSSPKEEKKEEKSSQKYEKKEDKDKLNIA